MTHPFAELALDDRDLYGGAIKMKVPTSFLDASEIRQIPDNQEVFVDMSSDSSLIVELLEMHSSPSVTESAEHHFWQLASDNDASGESQLGFTKPAQFAHGHPSAICVGTQRISKFNEQGEDTKNLVAVYQILIRLQEQETDVLITFNQTMQTGPHSSSDSSHTGVPSTSVTVTDEQFLAIGNSFQVVDMSLFG